jgi:hypothetical protein
MQVRRERSIDKQNSHKRHNDPQDLHDLWRKGDPDDAFKHPKHEPHAKREEAEVNQKKDNAFDHLMIAPLDHLNHFIRFFEYREILVSRIEHCVDVLLQMQKPIRANSDDMGGLDIKRASIRRMKHQQAPKR